MFRILLAALIIILLYRFWKGSGRRVDNSAKQKKNLPPGEMVLCEKCGTYVLKNEAVFKDGKFYCGRHCAT